MNQKNTLGLDYCFGDLENPTDLFKEWFNEAKKTEINDPNAFSLATCDKKGVPSVRIVLLKDFSNNGLVFYTNLNSKKSNDIKENPNGSICFHWKSLLRQIRINGKVTLVSDQVADEYYLSRAYESRIGAWASKQSEELNSREQLLKSIQDYKKKYSNKSDVPRPSHWSGWILSPDSIEFWLDGENRIHERLKYNKDNSGKWIKSLLSP